MTFVIEIFDQKFSFLDFIRLIWMLPLFVFRLVNSTSIKMGNTFAPNLSSSTVVVTANRSGMSQEFDENIVNQLTAYMTPEFYKLFLI